MPHGRQQTQAFNITPPSMTGTLVSLIGEIIASNPCSEYMFLDNTACNLASINLLQFLGEDGNFKYW